METMEQLYHQEFEEIPYEEQLDEIEYSKLKKCIGVVIAVSLLSALIYLVSGNKVFAGIPLVLTISGFCLINTNFGFLVLFFVPILEEWFVLIRGSLTLGKVIGIVIVISYVLTRLNRGLKFPTPLKLIITVIVWILLSSLWSPYLKRTFLMAVTYVLFGGLTVIFFNTVEGVKCLKLMLWSLFGGNVLIAFLLAIGKGIRTGRGSALTAIEAAYGEEGRLTFAEGGVGSNVVAIFLVFAAVLGFYLFLKSGFFFKIGIVLAELLLLFVLVKTESRSGLIYMIFVPLTTYVLASQKGYRLKTFLGVIFLLIIAYGLFYAVMKTDILPAKAKVRMETSMVNVTLTGRTVIWRRGINLFLQRPFQGWGWGSFPLKYSEIGGEASSAHSNFVLVAAELGIVGLSLFGILFLKLLFMCLKIQDYLSKWLGVMCLMWLFITGIGMTSMLSRIWWYVFMLVVRFIFLKHPSSYDGGLTEEDIELVINRG